MTKQNEIERLAKFMGWHKCAAGGFCDLESCSTGRGLKHLANDDVFNPFTRLDDAMMVAEKIGRMVLFAPGAENVCDGCFTVKGWFATFPQGNWYPSPNSGDETDSKTPAEAITLAALAYLDALENK